MRPWLLAFLALTGPNGSRIWIDPHEIAVVRPSDGTCPRGSNTQLQLKSGAVVCITESPAAVLNVR